MTGKVRAVFFLSSLILFPDLRDGNGISHVGSLPSRASFGEVSIYQAHKARVVKDVRRRCFQMFLDLISIPAKVITI